MVAITLVHLITMIGFIKAFHRPRIQSCTSCLKLRNNAYQFRMVQSDNNIELQSPQRIKVKKILESDSSNIVGQAVSIKGWVKTVRDQKKFSFIDFCTKIPSNNNNN